MNRPEPKRPHDAIDDADPMIDALLMEIVPSDSARRSSPPDLTASILDRLAKSTDDLDAENAAQLAETDDADPVIDTLLVEFLPGDPGQTSRPPDLTAQIIARLNDSILGDSKQGNPALGRDASGETDVDPVVDGLLPEVVAHNPARRVAPPDLSGRIMASLPDFAQQASPAKPIGTAANKPVWSRSLAVAVAIAACFVAVVWWQGLIPNNGDATQIAQDHSPSGPGPAADRSPVEDYLLAQDDSADNLVENDGSRGPIEGIPLDTPMVAVDEPSEPVPPADETPVLRLDAGSAEPIERVAAQTAQTARQYWDRLGIRPTKEASVDQLVARLKNRLGVALEPQDLTDAERLQAALASDGNAAEIAKRWLAVSNGNRGVINNASLDDGLVVELAEGISGRTAMDTQLVSLIDGSNPHSAEWYASFGQVGTEGIAKRLANISMNADLRCVKCHDSRIGRSGTQDDYWSFVSLVRSVVRKEDGRWQVTGEPKSVPTFYELPDGRQSLASPKVSVMLSESESQYDDFGAWTSSLLGSEALASSLVDSLWKLVHGRPLKPSPVDAFAPPFDETLNHLHDQLADDLISSRFDLSRTLALIIASPMARRSAPDALAADAMLTSSDQQRAEALELVGAFAAWIEPPRSSRNDRIDLAMRRIGQRLDSIDQGAMLAQPIGANPLGLNDRSKQQARASALRQMQMLSVDFPTDTSAFPVSWLRSIDDYEQQVQHLMYLSGGNVVPENVKEAADLLKESSSEEAALSRVWWILRN